MKKGLPRRRAGRLSDLFGIVVAAIAVAVCALVIYGGVQLSRTLFAVSSDPLRDLIVIAPAPSDSSRPALPGIASKLQRGERLSILLLGYGGLGHDGPFLTDSMMVASFDPSGRATLISIPRDLWVTLPRSKYSESYQAKLNTAFAIGANENDRDEGMRIASAVVADALGVPIDRTLAVDFDAFRKVVDAIGGIDVVVDTAFVSDYPRSDSEDDLGWITVSFKAGPQHMDGETALRFTRARYAYGPEGSDFARGARQQKVILAARNAIVTKGAAPKLFSLLDALRTNVRTDLSLADMQGLAELAKSYDDARTVHAALTPDNVLREADVQFDEGVAFILMPKIEGWVEVRQYIRRILDFPGSLDESPAIVVRASPRRAGAAEAAAARLRDLGFERVRTALSASDPSMTIVTGGASSTASYVASFFGATASDATGGADIVVDLGTDWVAPRESELPVFAPTPQPSASPSVSPKPTPRPTSSPPRQPSPTPHPSEAPRG